MNKKNSNFQFPIFKNRKNLFFLILLLVLALIGVKALFAPGFYTNHDGEHQVVRLWHFHQAVIDGQLPVRWAGTALNGFGYPLFIFTYPLPFWLGEVFLRTGLNLTDSIKAVFILTYVVSGLTMYFFAADLWKNRLAGFLSAFFYLWAPYRFSNLFVRASLGEHVSFIFIPLIFWGFLKIQKKQNFKTVLLFSLSLSGLIVSHMIIFQLVFLPLFIFWLALLLSSKRKIKFFTFSFIAGLLGFGLSAFYLLPLLQGKRLIMGLYPMSFSDHFPTIKQLLYSPWDYGFSLPGKVDGMAFQVGMAHWLVVGISLLFLLGSFFKKRRGFVKKNLLPLVFLILYFFSIFMIIKASLPFWRQIFKVIYLDFSWRLLFISVFASSLLVGFLVKIFNKNILIWFLIFGFLGLNLYANRNHLRVNKYVFNPDSFYQENKGTTTTFNEYIPKPAVHKIPVLQQAGDERVTIIEGEGEVKIKTLKSNLLEFELVNNESVDLDINTLYYPGWQVMVDGQQKDIDHLREGIVRVREIGPGKHQVVAAFKEPLFRKIANSISLFSLLLVSLILLKGKRYDKE